MLRALPGRIATPLVRTTLLRAALLWGVLGPAHLAPATASPAVTPGVQALPPGPPPPAPPALESDADQRRAIRGCPVDMDCRGHALAGLREFELETFGPGPGSSPGPWLDDNDPYGHNAIRQGRLTRGAPAGRGITVADPVALRPDLPWLADLDMPDLPVRWHPRLIQYLEFYKDDPRGRNIMRAWLRDQGRFRDMMLARLRRAGLPEDLIYVAMIESSYDPGTRSRVGAAGLWQFMPAAGRIYGLHIDRWIDERNDPVRSTDAVMTYFADLYQRFGDWHLAMAAFNAGYGAVLRSVARYNTNDIWELMEYENALPWGTMNYVPKAMAAAIVGRNRERFGFDDLDEAAPMQWDTATVPKSVSLSVVARAAGVSVETIEELNPQILRNRTPPTIDGYVVRIPAGSGALFAERFAQLRGDWDSHDAYVVAHGERFEDIATRYGLSRHRLAELNGIEHVSEVRGGMVLVVPRVSEEAQKRNQEKAEADLYTSGPVPSEEGEPLIVAVPDADFTIPERRRVFYRVVSGDTVSGVADAFGVSRDELAAWNDLTAAANLHPRMILQVFVAPDFDGQKSAGGLGPVALLDERRMLVVTRGSDQHIELMETRMGRERVIYQPEKEESFESIGKKFGLSARDLARINHRAHDTVAQPGDEIIIYKVVDKSRSDRAADQARSKARQKPSKRRGKK